jgi:hypothetical protein
VLEDKEKKVLVMGWFSFADGHTTAGDLLCRDLVCNWLGEAGRRFDVANVASFPGGVDWRAVSASSYSHVVFVCGPFQDGELEQSLRQHFAGVPLIGVNLSMVLPLDEYNPFTKLFERDSTRTARPDLVFATQQTRVPVVGVCLVEPYDAGLTEMTNKAIERLLAGREVAIVHIDTRLNNNATGLRSPGEIESLIAKMDVVVTTRLHGTVIALKNGVPALAIDPEVGGFKIKRQTQTLGWPVSLNVDELSDGRLERAFEYCLTSEAQRKARECANGAVRSIAAIRAEFAQLLQGAKGS